MNSRFKTEKTFICFRHYVATNLQQVCLPFCLLIASICDSFVQRITDHPVISTAFSQVSTVESFFSHAFRHVFLAISMWISPPLASKNTIFKELQICEKKTSDFSKKTQMNEKKLQKDSDKCWILDSIILWNHVEIEDFPWNVRHSWTSFMLPSWLIGATLAWWNTSTCGGEETWEPNSVIDIW